ncbi:MAG: TraB/GumN family protein [Sphingomonadaceae bacterium]
MKTLLATAAALALAACAQPVAEPPATAEAPPPTTAMETSAAALPDADPAMWVVRDEDTAIYMLGTFHLLDGKQQWFNDEVRAAYEAADEVVLEAEPPEDMSAVQQLLLRYARDPDGPPLSARLSEDMRAKLAAQLAEIGAPPTAFDQFDPWFVTMTLSALAAQKLGLTPEQGPETLIAAQARADGKPIGELEGFETQIVMFDGMPEEQQLEQLEVTLDYLEELPDQFGRMKAAWASGDVETLVAMITEGFEDQPELYRIIFSDRNARWAEWIDERLDTPGTVFMAVGVGHLAGEDSVQELLAARGIASERIEDEEDVLAD